MISSIGTFGTIIAHINLPVSFFVLGLRGGRRFVCPERLRVAYSRASMSFVDVSDTAAVFLSLAMSYLEVISSRIDADPMAPKEGAN